MATRTELFYWFKVSFYQNFGNFTLASTNINEMSLQRIRLMSHQSNSFHLYCFVHTELVSEAVGRFNSIVTHLIVNSEFIFYSTVYNQLDSNTQEQQRKVQRNVNIYGLVIIQY